MNGSGAATDEAQLSSAVDPGRRPVLQFWLIAVALEVFLGVAFLLSGAESAIDTGLSKAGIDFGSDLLTAVRVVLVYPAALLGVALALAQVAAPDLAVVLLARIRGGRTLLGQVGSRLRPWSREVGTRKGLLTWLTVVVLFTACNAASGLLHRSFIPGDFVWHFSWSMVALLPVAMFLDAGALLEESGWRGFALPALLRTRGPVAASVIVGLAWAAWHFPVKFDAFIDYGLWGALAYLGAFTVKIVAISVVMTFFWARAGQATLLAIAMHGLSNDVARVGGLADGDTWQASAISELDLAAPFIIVAFALIPYANRRGWGDLRPLPTLANGRS
jgi:membrane protease YdiL (CAAX protease family)